MIRVLIADDTATTRHFLVKILTQGGEIEIVGQAASGQSAVEMTRELRPDVVTMDIVMPGMDGVEATARIMHDTPTPIVVVSALEDIRKSSLSMNALNSGALAVLAIPPADSPDLSALAQHLRETVLAVAKVKSVRREQKKTANPATKAVEQTVEKARVEKTRSLREIMADHQPIEVCAIACSVGGPAALAKILGEMPKNFPLPILVTQHISRGFTEDLAGWLNHASPLEVRVAKDYEKLAGGVVYIAPDDSHLGLHTKTHLKVSTVAPIKGFRPAATFMFESVARVYKGSAVFAILTGMGDDGVAGLKIAREVGGIIIAQDEASSIVYGMPKAAVNLGLADLILPLEQIAKTLVTLAPEK